MKKTLTVLLVLLALCLAGTALAETRYVTFQEVYSAPVDAETLDLGEVKANKLADLEAYLALFPNLRQVDMFATPVTAKQIDELTALFPRVTFGWTIRIAEHTVRTDATAFSTLHTRDSKVHTSKDFAVLKYCPNLMALDLGHNAIEDISFLYDLPKLKVLILACNRLRDITPLSALPDLQYLELFSNSIVDVTPLAGLTNLLDLNLSYNRILDFTPLLRMDWLERLWLFNSGNSTLTKAATRQWYANLAAVLPNTHVDSKSAPTDGGWREHPRFDVIHTMFRTDQYIPFEEPVATEAPEAAS